MHRYQREDSVWANRYTTAIEDLRVGFDPEAGEMLPAFIRYDCASDRWETIDPPENSAAVRAPADDLSELRRILARALQPKPAALAGPAGEGGIIDQAAAQGPAVEPVR